MRLLWLSFLPFLPITMASVRAQDWVAIHPGLMCLSADALGKLTLPGGDSRTHLTPVPPADQATASQGGCIDIPLGAHVQVEQKFKNTSIVTYPDGGNRRLVIPNADFKDTGGQSGSATPAHSTPAAQASAEAEYRPYQRIPVGANGLTLVVLEDSRITQKIRSDMWNKSSDPGIALEDQRLVAEFEKKPLISAEVELLSEDGHIMARQVLEQPLAQIKPSGFHTPPSPTFVLTIDYSSGMGSYSGPFSELLMPAQTGLDAMKGIDDRGVAASLFLESTLKADWKIVPAKPGGDDVILSVNCAPDADNTFFTTYRTYRYHGGGWKLTSHVRKEFWEAEMFQTPAYSRDPRR